MSQCVRYEIQLLNNGTARAPMPLITKERLYQLLLNILSFACQTTLHYVEITSRNNCYYNGFILTRRREA